MRLITIYIYELGNIHNECNIDMIRSNILVMEMIIIIMMACIDCNIQ